MLQYIKKWKLESTRNKLSKIPKCGREFSTSEILTKEKLSTNKYINS